MVFAIILTEQSLSLLSSFLAIVPTFVKTCSPLRNLSFHLTDAFQYYQDLGKERDGGIIQDLMGLSV